MAELIVSLLGLIVSISYLAASLRIPLGSPAQPGPGLFPLLVGALLTSLSITLVVEAARRRRARVDGDVLPKGMARWRILGILMVLLGYTALLTTLGQLIAGTLMLSLVLWLLGMHRWRLLVPIAVLASLASYYVFSELLGVALPQGIWMP